MLPEKFAFGSGKEEAWCCSICLYKWVKRIADRTINGVKCESILSSKCVSNYYLTKNGSSAKNHPEILQWWNYERNTDVLPEEATSKKRLKVCGSSKKTFVYAKIDYKASESGCPTCSEEQRKKTIRKTLLRNGKSLAEVILNLLFNGIL